MNNLSLQTTFVILISMIGTIIEALPPGIDNYGDETFVNLAKKTQEPQKASSPRVSWPRGPLHGSNFDRGHWFLILAAMILMAISYIFEKLKIGCKKTK